MRERTRRVCTEVGNKLRQMLIQLAKKRCECRGVENTAKSVFK